MYHVDVCRRQSPYSYVALGTSARGFWTWEAVLRLIRAHKHGPPHPGLPRYLQTDDGELAVAWAMCVAAMGHFLEERRWARRARAGAG